MRLRPVNMTTARHDSAVTMECQSPEELVGFRSQRTFCESAYIRVALQAPAGAEANRWCAERVQHRLRRGTVGSPVELSDATLSLKAANLARL